MEIAGDNKILSLPDFLIVGGPRCGTSSLYSYLKEHPDVFMPDFKELLFFDNLSCNKPPHPNWPPWTVARYAELFEPARPEQKLGVASASYLYLWRASTRGQDRDGFAQSNRPGLVPPHAAEAQREQNELLRDGR